MSRTDKLQALLQKEPDDVFLNFGLGMELLKEGRADEALAQFDRVLSLDAAYVAAYLQKGTALIALQRKKEAADALTDGAAIARQSGDTHSAEQMEMLLATIH